MYNPIVDFSGKFAENNVPNHKRLPKYLAWVSGLMSGFARCNEVFRRYINGAQDSELGYFDVSPSYTIGIEVIYNYKIYKSLTNFNVGNIPDQSPDYWQETSPSFIGVRERSFFRGNHLVLEYALNRYFQKEIADNSFGGFVQPDSDLTPTPSTIYITNVTPAFTSFVSFPTEIDSSVSYSNGSSGYSFTGTIFAGQTPYYVSINIPSSVYASIGTPDIADGIIGNFINKYLASGIGFIITPY